MRRFFPILFLSVLAEFASLANAADKTSNAKLRLPWEVLREVMNLDAKNVRLSWDEYKTLLRLTSAQKVPDLRLSGGDVVLSRQEFSRLVQSLVPPAPPTADSFLSKAAYRGRLVGASAVFTAFLRLEVPRRPPKPLRIDLFPGTVAFQEILLDGKPALSRIENGRLFITVADAGSHKVELRYSAPVPESNAAQSLTIPIAQTPITEWILDIPEPRLDISVTPALNREISSLANGTRVRALLPPSDQVTATWSPLAPDTAKGEAQLYADVDHLVTVMDDALRIRSRVEVEVLHNAINTLTLDLPDGFTVLDVQGESLREWQEKEGKPATLVLPLRSARKGRMEFLVEMERVLPNDQSTTRFTGLTVRQAVRQRGFIGVELKSDAELPAPVTHHLEPKDPFRELPPGLSNQSDRLLYGYQYVRPPFDLNVAFARHESVSLVPSFIDRAEVTTVIRPDGKIVHQTTYFLRSSDKQFLEVLLPEGTQVWNAFVDGVPVKPVHGDGRKTLIPLVRSLRSDHAAFPVELVIYQERPHLSLLGREDLVLPMPDVLVSRLRWSVVTPADQTFYYLGNEFEKPRPTLSEGPRFRALQEKSAMGGFVAARTMAVKKEKFSDRGMEAPTDEKSLNLPQTVETDALKDTERREDGRDMPLSPPPLPGQMSYETSFSGVQAGPAPSLTAGILPVRVNVPAIGTSVTYTKTLPEPDAPLTLPLYHVSARFRAWLWTGVFIVLISLTAWTFNRFVKRKPVEGATP